MEYLKEEKVISIKELIYAVCSKWRNILSVVMISAVLVLLFNVYQGLAYMDILPKTIIFSEIIKQVLITVILLTFVMIFVYAVGFIFSDKVKTETELRMTMRLEVLGSISEAYYKKNIWIDEKLRNYIGLKTCDSVEKSIERVANVIVANKDVKYKGSDLKIAVVSSCSTETAKKCTEMLKAITSDGVKLVLAGDIMNSPDAVKAVTDADCIILAECIKKSKYSTINNVCKQLNVWNKDIMGIVVTD